MEDGIADTLLSLTRYYFSLSVHNLRSQKATCEKNNQIYGFDDNYSLEH